MKWYDRSFSWDPSAYDGISVQRVHPSKTWVPDIVLYNGATNPFSLQYGNNLLIYNNKLVVFIPPLVLKSICKLDLLYFPFDHQKCILKFGSWTFDGFTVDLQFLNGSEADISDYKPSQEWDLLGTSGERTDKYYSCCKEPYPDITYTLTLKRRSSFFVTTLLFPEVLLSIMALAVFFVPVSSGQKLTLGSVVLLCMCIMELYLQKVLNMNHGHLPIIGIYFSLNLALSVFSILASAFSLHCCHKDPASKMSDNTKTIVERVAKFLQMGSIPMVNYYSNLNVEKTSTDGQDKKTLIPKMTSENEVNLEWKFCSRVIDRFCLVFGTLIVIAYTFATFFRMVNNV